jgi:hypothetical protein
MSGRGPEAAQNDLTIREAVNQDLTPDAIAISSPGSGSKLIRNPAKVIGLMARAAASVASDSGLTRINATVTPRSVTLDRASPLRVQRQRF